MIEEKKTLRYIIDSEAANGPDSAADTDVPAEFAGLLTAERFISHQGLIRELVHHNENPIGQQRTREKSLPVYGFQNPRTIWMSSRQTGTLVQWNDEKGFGFIRPSNSSVEVFFHVSEFRGRNRPAEGMNVTFDLAEDSLRGPRASRVQVPQELSPEIEGLLMALAPGVFYFATIGIYAYFFRFPWWLATGYLVLSLIAYVAYLDDKNKAVRGSRRTPEKSLHWLGLLGGWPGALVAQWHLRHKNRKLSFQITFWTTVILNVAFTILFFMPKWARSISHMLPELTKHTIRG
jgi:uncharacterized membrane protein YsdA (DUF1294 family)/cold shock CspA family protein